MVGKNKIMDEFYIMMDERKQIQKGAFYIFHLHNVKK